MSGAADPSRTPISSVVDAHVREILAEAERAALTLQREVEEASMARGLELRRAAEREAAQIRVRAQDEADAYLEECRRRSEAFATGRVTRLQELSDTLLARGETVRGRLLEAEDLQLGLAELVAALAAAARAAASEAGRPVIDLPRLIADSEPPAEGEDEDAAGAEGRPEDEVPSEPASPPAQVRVIASDLPRLPRRPPRPAPPPPEEPPSA